MGYTSNKVMDDLKSGGIKLQHETHEPTVIGMLPDLSSAVLCCVWFLVLCSFSAQPLRDEQSL